MVGQLAMVVVSTPLRGVPASRDRSRGHCGGLTIMQRCVRFFQMAELTITFLGTGTSQGVPVIGCACAVCSSGDPRDKRTRSLIHVESPECSWVVDTGNDFRVQCLREKIGKLDAVVYTHSHTD